MESKLGFAKLRAELKPNSSISPLASERGGQAFPLRIGHYNVHSPFTPTPLHCPPKPTIELQSLATTLRSGSYWSYFPLAPFLPHQIGQLRLHVPLKSHPRRHPGATHETWRAVMELPADIESPGEVCRIWYECYTY